PSSARNQRYVRVGNDDLAAPTPIRHGRNSSHSAFMEEMDYPQDKPKKGYVDIYEAVPRFNRENRLSQERRGRPLLSDEPPHDEPHDPYSLTTLRKPSPSPHASSNKASFESRGQPSVDGSYSDFGPTTVYPSGADESDRHPANFRFPHAHSRSRSVSIPESLTTSGPPSRGSDQSGQRSISEVIPLASSSHRGPTPLREFSRASSHSPPLSRPGSRTPTSPRAPRGGPASLAVPITAGGDPNRRITKEDMEQRRGMTQESLALLAEQERALKRKTLEEVQSRKSLKEGKRPVTPAESVMGGSGNGTPKRKSFS
ncbi:hypothetical protein LTS18_010583, partial [Coniosporium uncinatum]